MAALYACAEAATAPNGNGAPPAEVGTDPQPTPSSTGDTTTTGIENSQTGSVGQSPIPECEVDADCAVLPSWTGSVRVELVSAACSHDLNSVTVPLCECVLRATADAPDAGTAETREYRRYPGNRDYRCSEHSFWGSCLYCGNEFPGCNIDDLHSCDAVCTDMTEREENDIRREHEIGYRLARCNEDRTCRVVTTIDGQCYLAPFGRSNPEPVDCSLGDAELLQRLAVSSGKEECQPRPTVNCATSSDCPRGLSCAGGVCGPCTQSCITTGSNGDDGWECEGGGACADGEVCVDQVCVPGANATECNWFGQCPENQLCVVSGVSSTGRGNEDTRSFCR